MATLTVTTIDNNGTPETNPNYGQATIDTMEVPDPVASWDEFDFRKRFTRDERKAILAASKQDADVQDFEEMLKAAGRTGTVIKADDTLLNEALDALTLAGLLGPGRKNEILGES
jgi:hypothetical protein